MLKRREGRLRALRERERKDGLVELVAELVAVIVIWTGAPTWVRGNAYTGKMVKGCVCACTAVRRKGEMDAASVAYLWVAHKPRFFGARQSNLLWVSL